jgi:hypothetical protein
LLQLPGDEPAPACWPDAPGGGASLPFFIRPGGGGAMPCFIPPGGVVELEEPLGPVMALPGIGGDPGGICMSAEAAGGDPGGGGVELSACATNGARTSAESRLRAAICFFMRAPGRGCKFQRA